MRLLSSLLFAVCFTAVLPTPSPAEGKFLGIFGKNREQQLPEQAEMERREGEAAQRFAKAREREQAGRLAAAAKDYLKVARDFPVGTLAADAAFRAGELYESAGRPEKAVEAFQFFVDRYKNDKRFNAAVEAQFRIANACKEGEHKSRMMGFGGVTRNETIEMYQKVIANAPRSSMAADSWLAIADIHLDRGDAPAAVQAYENVIEQNPRSKQAAEAQFRMGQTFIEKSERRDNDRGTVVSAREAFEDYLLENPGSARAGEVRGQLDTIGDREARKVFDVARFYERTKKPQAAAIYYREAMRIGSPEIAGKARARLLELGADPDAPEPAPRGFFDEQPSTLREREDFVGPASTRREAPAMRYDPLLLPLPEFGEDRGFREDLLDEEAARLIQDSPPEE